MANTVIFTANTKFNYQQNSYWVQDADRDYSISMPSADAFRFEVRAGDVWSAVDQNTINRSEISSVRLIENGTPIHVAYKMNIEQGSLNTANWAVLGQFHQNDVLNAPAGSPPFSINLNGEKMAINVAYTSASGAQTSLTVFSDTADIMRAHDYTMDINIVFDPNGNGHLSVVRDGIKIVDYNGPLGYSTQQSVYWKEGIYRAASAETLAVTYSGLTLETSAPTIMASTKLAGPETVNQYSNTGDLLSTTTHSYDANGTITNKTIITIGKGTQVLNYGILGKSYGSENACYDFSGTLKSLIRYHTDGTLDYFFNTAPNGITTASSYDAAGVLTSSKITQADGSWSVSHYVSGQTSPQSYTSFNASGAITFSQVLNVDGTKSVQHFGIVGQTYSSDLIDYDASGNIKLLKQFRLDESLSFQQSMSTTGITTSTNYDLQGGISNIGILQADGSRSAAAYGIDKSHPVSYQLYDSLGKITLNDVYAMDGSRKIQRFSIIGQPYAFITTDYDPTGRMTCIRQFRPDGTLSYQQSVGATGAITYTTYDLAGGTTNQNSVQLDGSRSLTTYGADKTKPASLITYNSAGKMTLHQQFDINGKIILNDIFNVDGSRKTQHFGIVGQAYSSDTFDYNAAGALVGHRQFNADGSLRYQKSISLTGVTTYTNYDTVGGIINRSVVQVDGARSLATYGADKTKPASLISYNSAGKITVNQQFDVNGTMTLNDIFNSDGSRKTQHFGITGQNYASDTCDYNSAGLMISLRQFHTDGSLSYQKTTSPTEAITYINYDSIGGVTNRNVVQVDGARTYATYGADKTRPASLVNYDSTGKMILHQEFDSAGKIILNDIFNADGSRKIQHFGIIGQPYVSDTFDYNTMGNLVSMRQYHADGTLNYSYSTNTNGSNNKTSYDAAGSMTQNVTTNLDGSLVGKAWGQGATFTSGNLNDAFTSYQADTFVFNSHFGHDIIYGFNAGDGANHDFIQFNNSLVQDFAHLQINQVGADVSIRVSDADNIILKNINVSSLTAQDFLFR